MSSMNAHALLEDNTHLHTQVESLTNEKDALQSQLLQANAQLEWLKRQLFGQKSEKIIPQEDKQQLLLEGFDLEETTPQKETPIKGHTRTKDKNKKDNNDCQERAGSQEKSLRQRVTE